MFLCLQIAQSTCKIDVRLPQQDVANTWLCDAVANGSCRILTGVHVNNVLIEEGVPAGHEHSSASSADCGSAAPHRRSKRAVGVSASILGAGQQPHPRLPHVGEAKLVIRYPRRPMPLDDASRIRLEEPEMVC